MIIHPQRAKDANKSSVDREYRAATNGTEGAGTTKQDPRFYVRRFTQSHNHIIKMIKDLTERHYTLT
ncbi:MAG: hypothetical protein AAB393_15170, partial [Bacteroidota bacterium]